MTEKAVVTEVRGSRAKVRFVMSEGCHACNSKDACSSSQGRVLSADVPDGLTVRPGDTIELEISASAHLWGLLFLVLIPVLLFGTAYLVVDSYTNSANELPAALAGIGGLVVGLGLALLITSRGRLAARPRITALVRPE